MPYYPPASGSSFLPLAGGTMTGLLTLPRLTAAQPVGFTGTGTVSNSAGSGNVTGVGTLFLSEFYPNDTITIGGQTVLINSISSNTAMNTATITNANSGVAYTGSGGTRLKVLDNGRLQFVNGWGTVGIEQVYSNRFEFNNGTRGVASSVALYTGSFVSGNSGFNDSAGNSKFNLSESIGGLLLGSARYVKWASTDNGFNGTPDTGLYRNAAGGTETNTGTAGTYGYHVAKEFRFAAPTSANGQYISALSLTELTTIAAAATTDTTIQMPAGAIILAVSVRNTVAVTCTSTYSVGDSGNSTRFASGVSKAVNTTNGGAVTPYLNASALSVRITPDTTPSDATGRVRVTIHYFLPTPPTS